MSTEEKQNFLREKILDKGYDTSQFVQFLTEKKGEDGADVANWTMEDLIQVVNEFIKLNGGTEEIEEKQEKQEEPKKESKKKVSMFDIMPDTKPKKPDSQLNINPQSKSQSSEIKKSQNNLNITQSHSQNAPKVQKIQTTPVNNSNNMTGTESEYGIIIKDVKECKPLEQTELSKYNKLKITVTKPEKKTEGFFSKTYVTYMVSTMPASYVVHRRYTDFTWLRNTLLNLFPANSIPPIPKKNKIVGDNFAPPINLKRGRFLEKFMNYLASDPIIKNSQIFFDFLYIGAETDFNSKKKVYEKVKSLSDVNEFRNENSKVEIMINSEKENYVENIKDNITNNINILKKINTSFKLLYDEVNAVTTRLDEIASLWAQMYKSSQKYFDHNTSCECYKQLSNLFVNWSKILKQQNNVVNVDIREHFKFMRKNFGAMKDLTNSLETPKSNYNKASKNLMYKKDDLFKRNDTAKWELDPHDKIEMSKILNNKKAAFPLICKKETLNVIGLKEFYGLILNRIISEYERMRELNANLSKNIINNNLKKLTDISGQFLIFAGEINSAIDLCINDHSNDNKCKLKRIPLEI
jgi:hypothetical protein